MNMSSNETELKIVNVQSLCKDFAVPSTSKQNTAIAPKNDKFAYKPLLILIKHLVNFMDNEEKTVLTNAQLLEILQSEFNIDIENLHGLEIDIYMNVLKKFLKFWPKWDSIDLIVQKAKHDKSINIEDILGQEYNSLKAYLQDMLNLSRAPTEEAVMKLKRTPVPTRPEAFLEVCCSKNQLYNLFYQYPHPTTGIVCSVSNDQKCTKISITNISFNEIFNWPFVSITIETSSIKYERKNAHQFKHTLINNRLGFKPPPPVISRDVLIKPKSRSTSFASKNQLLLYLDNLKSAFKDTSFHDVLECIRKLIMGDLSLLPETIYKTYQYIYYLNKFPYVRYIMNKVEGSNPSTVPAYSLELQEYTSPCVIFHLHRFDPFGSLNSQLQQNPTNWLKVKCELCDQMFTGLGPLQDLKQHFLEMHCDEPDWACSHCGKSFTMQVLAGQKWKHKC